jgi:hypothetical protein
MVFQFGALLVVLVGGVIPIAKWYEDRITRIKEDKPIVVTDWVAEDRYQIRNIGNAPAVNVWLVVEDQPSSLHLGSLDAHEERTLVPSATRTIERTATARHILLAAARPLSPRPYTVTFNTRATDDEGFRHGFQEANEVQLRRKGTVEEYLRHERVRLLQELNAFAGPKVKNRDPTR